MSSSKPPPEARALPELTDASVAIVSNGFSEGPPTALRDWLLERRVKRVTTIFHPLGRDDGARHQVREWHRGELVSSRDVLLPSRPPFTYPLDLLVPVLPQPVNAWFAFNGLACLRGLLARRAGRADRVVYWPMDYVESRFGRSLMTRVFEGLEGYCCRHADARFEVSDESRAARDGRQGGSTLAPAAVLPLGAWVERVPRTDPDPPNTRKVIFLGHVVERQGVAHLVEALGILNRRGVPFRAEIVGRGPLEAQLRDRAEALGIGGLVKFHGFVADFREVERILATGTVAVAPYDTDASSFTRFADPGKLKAYLAAGLPIVLTDVPPNAHELAAGGAAELVTYDPAAIADAITRVLDSAVEYRSRREASLRLARAFDWNAILSDALLFIGFRV